MKRIINTIELLPCAYPGKRGIQRGHGYRLTSRRVRFLISRPIDTIPVNMHSLHTIHDLEDGERWENHLLIKSNISSPWCMRLICCLKLSRRGHILPRFRQFFEAHW